MSDSYVCSGATMRCSMGTSQAKLTVLPVRTVFLTGQPMANISDHLTMVNLAPFGRCRSLGFPATAAATAAAHGKLTPMPCSHNTPFPWMGGKNDYIVKGDPALLKSSTCSCMWGGTISIVDDGQKDTGAADLGRMAQVGFAKNQQISKSLNNASLVNHKLSLENYRNKDGFMSDEDADLKKSNANYGKDKQYGINCATTTTTFMLRKRGYNVTAKARDANEHTDSIAYGLNLYDAWRNPDGSAVSPTMLLDKFNSKVEEKGLSGELDKLKHIKNKLIELQDSESNQTENYISHKLKTAYSEIREKFAPIYKEVLMDACKEEGYYTFGLVWEAVDIGGGHYTVLKSEKDSNGNIVLTNIEPQTGDPFNSIDEMISYLDFPPDSDDTVLRIDDKVFNSEYNDLFDIMA